MKMPTNIVKDSSRAQRRREAIRLHEIEDNPFTAEDNALFEMFDRKGWSDEQRREFLMKNAKCKAETAASAAE